MAARSERSERPVAGTHAAAIRRGTFQSVRELTAAIGAFIDAYNDRCQPFAWNRDAGQLIAKIRPSQN